MSGFLSRTSECSLRRSARNNVPSNEQTANQRARQRRAGASPSECRDDSDDSKQRDELDADDGGQRHDRRSRDGIYQFSAQPESQVLAADKDNETKRERQDHRGVMPGSRSAEAAEVAVLRVQRDDEEQGERNQVDQHDHPL